MNIKRILIMVMCALMAISITSCLQSNDNIPPTTTSPTTTQPTIETPTQIPTPEKIGNMTFGTAFYKAQIGSSIYNVDITDATDYEILAAKCLQGLVAREQSAQIYLSEDENDNFWLSRFRDQYGFIVKNITLTDMFSQFGGVVENIVVYNSENENSKMSAVYTASLNNGVAVAQEYASNFAVYFKNAVVVDTQATVSTSDECVDNALSTAQGMYVASVDGDCEFIDYLYAVKAPIVCVDDDNVSALEKLLKSDKFERPAVLFCDEDEYLKLASQNGFGTLNIDGFSNATLFSSFTNADASKGAEKGASRYSEEIENYVSIEIVTSESDFADSFSYLLKNSRRGSTAITLNISPAIYELAPPVAAWYQAGRRAATSFSAKDIGYMNVDISEMNEEYLKTFFERSKPFVNGFGFSIADVNVSADELVILSENLPGITPISSEDTAVTVINIDNIYSFSDFKLPQAQLPFYCVRVNAEDITTSTFQQLENLVVHFQEKNDNTEFVLCEDLLATIKEFELETQTTTTTTTATSAAQQ